MTDLEYWPQDLGAPLSFVRGVLSVFHRVAELEERVFDVVEAVGGRLASARGADGWHGCAGVVEGLWLEVEVWSWVRLLYIASEV